MKLSDAIRAGARLWPRQAFYALVNADELSACALGAACAAVPGQNLFLKFPQLSESSPMRCCPGWGDLVWMQITHLNDAHRWTREAIADWLDTLDAPDAVSAEFNKVASEAEPALVEVLK